MPDFRGDKYLFFPPLRQHDCMAPIVIVNVCNYRSMITNYINSPYKNTVPEW